MKTPLSRAIPLTIKILLSCAQACKSSRPRDWYLKGRKADYETKLKELKEAKEIEKGLSKQLLEQKEQNPVLSVIEQEEKILEMMEDQVLPDGSRYRYILANQSNTAPRTGQPKYLPVDTCKSYGSGCRSSEKYLHVGRQRRSFTSGLIKAGEKLLDGSPDGFIVEMFKTIAKPIYNWMISIDNDPVMEKFTNRILLETQFRHMCLELLIQELLNRRSLRV